MLISLVVQVNEPHRDSDTFTLRLVPDGVTEPESHRESRLVYPPFFQRAKQSKSLLGSLRRNATYYHSGK